MVSKTNVSPARHRVPEVKSIIDDYMGQHFGQRENPGVGLGTIYRTHQAGICFGDADAEMPGTPNSPGMSGLPCGRGGICKHGEEGGSRAGQW